MTAVCRRLGAVPFSAVLCLLASKVLAGRSDFITSPMVFNFVIILKLQFAILYNICSRGYQTSQNRDGHNRAARSTLTRRGHDIACQAQIDGM